MKTAIRDPIKERLDYAKSSVLPFMVPILLSDYGKHKNISKDTTETDLKADKACVDRIKNKYPSDSILSEESGIHPKNNPYEWVIDPLDSTYNFKRKRPFFTVSIALKKHGELQGGIVYHPHTKSMFHAQRGKGAYINDAPISVTPINKLDAARVSLVHNLPYEKHNLTGLREKLESKIKWPEKLACTSLELANVASGLYDGFVKPTDNPWGISAGMVLVKEAGGKVTIYKSGNIFIPVASNPHIHKSLCNIVENYFK